MFYKMNKILIIAIIIFFNPPAIAESTSIKSETEAVHRIKKALTHDLGISFKCLFLRVDEISDYFDRLLQNADFPNYYVLQKNNCNKNGSLFLLRPCT